MLLACLRAAGPCPDPMTSDMRRLSRPRLTHPAGCSDLNPFGLVGALCEPHVVFGRICPLRRAPITLPLRLVCIAAQAFIAEPQEVLLCEPMMREGIRTVRWRSGF